MCCISLLNLYSWPSLIWTMLIRTLANPNKRKLPNIYYYSMPIFSHADRQKYGIYFEQARKSIMAAAAVTKWTHKTLTIDQNLEILDKIGKKSYNLLSEEYGVGRLTISNIKRREASLCSTNAWLHQQDEGSVCNLSSLRELRELAARKLLTSIT